MHECITSCSTHTDLPASKVKCSFQIDDDDDDDDAVRGKQDLSDRIQFRNRMSEQKKNKIKRKNPKTSTVFEGEGAFVVWVVESLPPRR